MTDMDNDDLEKRNLDSFWARIELAASTHLELGVGNTALNRLDWME